MILPEGKWFVEWRSGMGTVGIVVAYDEIIEKWKGYIGVAQGLDYAQFDAEHIAGWGARLSYREAVGFFPWLKNEQYYEG